MEEPESDLFRTIASPAEGSYKDRNSKFLSFAYPVSAAEDAAILLAALRKKYYDATHICYAYRCGAQGEIFRINDDGEPSGTAGRPILGQLVSSDITYCLVAVVRYFGGTKLGVPGLINAYRTAAAEAISSAVIVERSVDTILEVSFPYVCMNDIMRIVKEEQPRIISQHFDNLCTMTLAIRRSRAQSLLSRIGSVEGAQIR